MNTDNLIMYVGFVILAFALWAVLIRWILDIPGRNRHLEAQTKLLAEIAKKSGVATGEIEDIVKPTIKA